MNRHQILFLAATGHERYQAEIVAHFRDAETRALILQEAFTQRVFPAVVQVVSSWCPDLALEDKWRHLLAQTVLLREAQARELAALAASGYVPPQSVMIPKGIAMARWYSGGLPRLSGDIDLTTAREEHYWSLLRWLVARGYRPWSMGAAYPVIPAQERWHYIFVYGRALPELEPPLLVEAMCSATSITPRLFFDQRPMMERARSRQEQRGSDGDAFFLMPTREDHMLTLLVETSERPLLVRDAVDLGMLIGPGAGRALELDWEAVWPRLEEERLVIPFLRLVAFYQSLAGARLPRPISATARRWAQRTPFWRFQADHAIFSYVLPLQQRQQGRLRALYEAMLTVRDTVALSDTPWLDRLALRSWLTRIDVHQLNREKAYVSLLLITDQIRGPLTWHVGSQGKLLLRTPVGVFLATREIEFEEDSISMISKLLPADWLASAEQEMPAPHVPVEEQPRRDEPGVRFEA